MILRVVALWAVVSAVGTVLYLSGRVTPAPGAFAMIVLGWVALVFTVKLIERSRKADRSPAPPGSSASSEPRAPERP